MSTQDVRAEALLNIRCIVKGSHLCRFEVNVGEVSTATKKRGERGNAFKVVNHRGQLGHRDRDRDRGSSLATTCRYFSVCEFFLLKRL